MARFISSSDPLDILLVEDSKGDAIFIEKALAQALPDAYKLQRVENLVSALKILAEKQFDVVLLDRSLPDVSGFSGLHSIQNMAPNLPIIFLTSFKDETAALNAVENGAQDYLFKDKVDGQTIKRSIQFAIHRKQFESILITQANFDALTELANRTLFESRVDIALARMQRSIDRFGIFFMDLDHFKEVNDTFGHSAGDQLLKEIAERLKKSIRPYDTAARFGGDEFAVLLEGIAEPEHFKLIAHKIIQLMAEPFIINGNKLYIGISIGITICTNSENSREQLMSQADAAMYEAKASSQHKYMFYDSETMNLISKL
jgi:diguanylate cyclase (GGDEF)-like protein